VNTIGIRMKTLLDLKIPSLIKIDERTASMRINSDWDVKITILEKSIIYEARSKGKLYNPKKDVGVPEDVKGVIEALEDKFSAALIALLDEEADYSVQESEKDPLDNLKAGGFSFDQEIPLSPEKVPQIVNDSTSKETPEKTFEDKINEDEAKKEAEEKARNEREENIKRLEELERLEQAAAELEAKKAQDETKKAKEPAPVEPSGTYQSKTPLLDMIYDYVGNDVLEVFGDTGSGKTAFVKRVAYEAAAAGKKVFYLDTERNLTKADIDLLKKCTYQYTPVIGEIDRVIQNLPAGDVVILDSVGFPVLTTFARMNMKQKGDALLKMIAIFGSLKEWAYKNNGIVLVTNQPESEFNKEPNHVLRPFGDKSQFAAKEIWETLKAESKPGLTTSAIKAFRSRSVGRGTHIAAMKITNSGVEVIQ